MDTSAIAASIISAGPKARFLPEHEHNGDRPEWWRNIYTMGTAMAGVAGAVFLHCGLPYFI